MQTGPPSQSGQSSARPTKLSQKFKQQSKQTLMKQPPIYLISSIKDKNIVLDLDLVQADDINVIGILFALEGINKIVLFCQQGKKMGANSQTPIYSSSKFIEFLRQLGKIIQTSKTLKSVHVERVPLAPKHLLALKSCLSQTASLKQLSLRHCSLSDEHLQALKPALTKNQSLVILDLSNNKLENSGTAIGKIMSEHSTRRDQLIWFASLRGENLEDDLSKRGICEVNLEGNQYDDKAVLEMVEFLKNDQWIRCLNLKGNRIGAEGVKQFAKLMKKNNSLISLDLRGNPGFTKEYSMYILKKLKQNIQKYKQQKKSFVKHKETQQQVPSAPAFQKQNKYSQHKSLQQSRRKQKLGKGQTTLQFSTLNLNLNLNPNQNLTSFQKSHHQHKNPQKQQQTLSQSQQCKKCKQKLLTILKLQKNSLDLQLELKKLKNILLTKNIDLSAILPLQQLQQLHSSHSQEQHPVLQRNPVLSSTLTQFLNPCETDEDLLVKLTKIMEHIDLQSHTQIVNMSNNAMSAVGELSNTIPIFGQQEELGALWESSIGGTEDREHRGDSEVTTERIDRSIVKEKSSKKKVRIEQRNSSSSKRQIRQFIETKQERSLLKQKPKQKQSTKKQKIILNKQLNS